MRIVANAFPIVRRAEYVLAVSGFFLLREGAVRDGVERLVVIPTR
jgi:hypothetical protein